MDHHYRLTKKVAVAIASVAFILPLKTDAQAAENRRLPLQRAPHGITLTSSQRAETSPKRQATQAEAVSVPWTYEFNESDLGGFTVIDVAGEGGTARWNKDPNGGDFATISGSVYKYDDWLITPPITTESGRAYEVQVDMSAGLKMLGMVIPGDAPEHVAIYWGTEPTVEAMTNVICPLESFSDGEKTFSGFVSPGMSGPIYIGIHAAPVAESFFLNADAIRVMEGVEATRPGVVTDLEIVPDPMDGPSAQITFKAPALDMDGNPLSEALTQIVVLRDNKTIKTFDAPAMGKELSCTDVDVPNGNRVYTVVAHNRNGEGEPLRKTIWVGTRVPSDIEGLFLEETDVEGTVSLTWDLVKTSADGISINPELVEYYVRQIDTYNNFTDVSDDARPGIEWAASPADQTLVMAAVSAGTLAGCSKESLSNIIIAGPAWNAPFYESFSHAMPEYPALTATLSGDAEWYTMDEGGGIPSADGDNGFLVMMAGSGEAEYITGKIDLAELTTPGLSFFTYNIARISGYPDTNEIAVFVREQGGEFTEVKRVKMCDLGQDEGWYRVGVPLERYSGKKVQLRFVGVKGSMGYTLLDNISVTNFVDKDLSVSSVSVPEHLLKPGAEFEAKVIVENLGYNAASGYKVALFADEVQIAETEGPEIAAGDAISLTFPVVLPQLQESDVMYYAEVMYDGDAVASNNASIPALLCVVSSGLPVIQELKAACEGNSVKLAWNAPDLTLPACDFVYEDFENQQSWATSEVGEWIFLDEDKGYIGGFANWELAGIQNASQQSWFVMDNDGLDPVDFFAHSGQKYLGQMYVYGAPNQWPPINCDDWAISPELSGDPQTVSFWGRSLTADARDAFQFLISYDGTDVSDFESIYSDEEVPASWKLYEFEVPEGTRHFAVRATANYGFMLLIDDVSYERNVAPSELELIGYNVFRDGEILNSEPVAEPAYEDVIADGKGHRYAVTALYTIGESSSTRTVITASVGDLESDSTVVNGGRGEITVTAAQGSAYMVTTPDGKSISTGVTEATLTTIKAAPGIYVVRVAGKTFKVIVK